MLSVTVSQRYCFLNFLTRIWMLHTSNAGLNALFCVILQDFDAKLMKIEVKIKNVLNVFQKNLYLLVANRYQKKYAFFRLFPNPVKLKNLINKCKKLIKLLKPRFVRKFAKTLKKQIWSAHHPNTVKNIQHLFCGKLPGFRKCILKATAKKFN